MRLQRDEGEHYRLPSEWEAHDDKARSTRSSAVVLQRKRGTESESLWVETGTDITWRMLHNSVEGQMIKYLAFVSRSILPPLTRFSADILN